MPDVTLHTAKKLYEMEVSQNVSRLLGCTKKCNAVELFAWERVLLLDLACGEEAPEKRYRVGLALVNFNIRLYCLF